MNASAVQVLLSLFTIYFKVVSGLESHLCWRNKAYFIEMYHSTKIWFVRV